MHDTGTAQRHQFNLTLLARFEAHCSSGGDIETIASCLLAIELQCRVNLREVIMGTDLNWSVSVIFNDNTAGSPADVKLYIAVFNLIFSVIICYLRLSDYGR